MKHKVQLRSIRYVAMAKISLHNHVVLVRISLSFDVPNIERFRKLTVRFRECPRDCMKKQADLSFHCWYKV